MDQFDLDEIDEAADKKAPGQASMWRSGIIRRLFARLKLMVAWLRRTVMPQYGWRILFSMVLITAGRLLDAASFVVGVHLLTRAFPDSAAGDNNLQAGIVWAAIGLGAAVSAGSILSYIGNKLAVQIVLEYESSCLVEGLAIIRHYQGGDANLTNQEVNSILRQAPRAMARSLLQIVGACTSFVLMVSGLVTCSILFPGLTVVILACLLLISPLYVVAAIYSTNIGHNIRLSAAAYSTSIKDTQSKWLSEETFKRDIVRSDIENNRGYKAFQDAYGARLTLSSRNHLLGSLTLALLVVISLVWFSVEVDLSADILAIVIAYIVGLRLFAQGIAGIFGGVQVINASLPFYLLFLTKDPRLAEQSGGGGD